MFPHYLRNLKNIIIIKANIYMGYDFLKLTRLIFYRPNYFHNFILSSSEAYLDLKLVCLGDKT